MQARFPDATDFYNSLDDVYYYGGQNGHNFEAAMSHDAANSDEISFKKGDLLGIAGNHWDGYSVATHIATNRKGKFPSYKVFFIRGFIVPSFHSLTLLAQKQKRFFFSFQADEHFVTFDMPHYNDRTDL